eukprot:gene2258-2559_t
MSLMTQPRPQRYDDVHDWRRSKNKTSVQLQMCDPCHHDWSNPLAWAYSLTLALFPWKKEFVETGTPIMQHLTNIKWEFSKTIQPDFVFGHTSCALLLSLKDHRLKPTQVFERTSSIPSYYELRVLVVIVDVDDCVALLEELSYLCVTINLTLIVSWSIAEAARYMETFRTYENKTPDIIRTKQSDADKTITEEALTSIKMINKSDVKSLLATYGSVKRIFNSSKEAMSLVPGLGPKKLNALHQVLHQPFKVDRPYEFLPLDEGDPIPDNDNSDNDDDNDEDEE